jgi:hypothetical protein
MHICEKHLRQKLAEKMSIRSYGREREQSGGVPQGPSERPSRLRPHQGWAPKQQLQTLCSFIIEDAVAGRACFSSRWLITRAADAEALLLHAGWLGH